MKCRTFHAGLFYTRDKYTKESNENAHLFSFFFRYLFSLEFSFKSELWGSEINVLVLGPTHTTNGKCMFLLGGTIKRNTRSYRLLIQCDKSPTASSLVYQLGDTAVRSSCTMQDRQPCPQIVGSIHKREGCQGSETR